ncbi:MAG: DUF362 domain-containing protein [Polyangiaceae bacterium]
MTLVSRRDCLLGALGLAAAGCVGTEADSVPAPPHSDASTSTPKDDAFPSPTNPSSRPTEPSFARVVEVAHAGAIVDRKIQEGPVRAMLSSGMMALTGAASVGGAFSSFFSPNDVVGIKVNPTGYPAVFSQIATVRAIVDGLLAAGVAPSRIVVFDRYRDSFEAVGYPAYLPQGVRFAWSGPGYMNDQTGIDGYDTAHFVDIPRVYPGDDVSDPHKRRSYLCNIVAKDVTKVINVPNLKDHTSAGLTMALKNMTYGLVNNVSRTHVDQETWTRDFIPVVASMPALRQKVVLHIADALVACYDGGPSPDHPNFSVFEYGALFFATDPVAMDRIGLSILDAERTRRGLPRVADCGLKLENRGHEAFNARQPDHIEACAAAGLGIADMKRIQHERVIVG